MRRLALLMILFAWSAPGVTPASAAEARKPPAPVAVKPETSAGLRGPMSVDRNKPAKAPPLASAIPPGAGLVTSSAGGDPAQCRLACAHSYYFCLAGENADACSGNWTQCLTACSRPARP